MELLEKAGAAPSRTSIRTENQIGIKTKSKSKHNRSYGKEMLSNSWDSSNSLGFPLR